MIAEHEPIFKEALAKLATLHGYEVVCVTDGVDLTERATIGKFDAILTAINLPYVDGPAAAASLSFRGITTPIIALTALSPDEMAAISGRFHKVFQKPLNIEELFSYIDAL